LPRTGPDKIALHLLREEPLGAACWDRESSEAGANQAKGRP